MSPATLQAAASSARSRLFARAHSVPSIRARRKAALKPVFDAQRADREARRGTYTVRGTTSRVGLGRRGR